MKYIAILGRQPEFGLAELESRLGSAAIQPFGLHAALIDRQIDINRFGGIQKIGEILYQGRAIDLNEAPVQLESLPISQGKTTFGLSYYGLQTTPNFVTAAGLTLKKRLRTHGSVRFVAPTKGSTSLSAAQVKFNGLTTTGFELLVVVSKQQMIIAITRQIQDIDWYAARDYERPSRSAQVGMLPPKLAQMMVNTTSAPLVYDPFCGTGVVLQEALLLGRAATGSDISEAMVQSSTDNLVWLTGKRPELKQWSVVQADATTAILPKRRLAIVSEGYLGPNQTKPVDKSTYLTLRGHMSELYLKAFANWASQLQPESEVSITTPVWRTVQGWKGLNLVDQITDLGYTLKQFAHAPSGALIYRRPNQIVGRQLLMLRKN
jgi:tRNA G10  N-methylase Trm11